jgi:hypothetical protein
VLSHQLAARYQLVSRVYAVTLSTLQCTQVTVLQVKAQSSASSLYLLSSGVYTVSALHATASTKYIANQTRYYNVATCAVLMRQCIIASVLSAELASTRNNMIVL